MSAFHYMAVKITESKNKIIYNFYPNYIEDLEIKGKFILDLRNWKPFIIESANHRDDERCINALTYKVKKFYDENDYLPEKVFHIA